MSQDRILPVILSGGAGTRLWPLSRAGRPKQFIPLVETETMLGLTLARVADRTLYEAPLIVASTAHAELVEAELEANSTAVSGLILEPSARNTAPAIALAALSAATPDQLLLVMPSDHLIRDPAALHAAVRAAMPFARDGYLVTFGIRPKRAETAYGYIRRGEELAPGIFAADRFIEKPDAVTAERYLSEGGYDWNAGIFLVSAQAYLDALATHAPDVRAAAEAAMANGVREGRCVRPEGSAFARSPSTSIDYAVMEKADRVAVVPVAMEWSDVGSWDALHEVSARDGLGNSIAGDVLAIDTKDCLLRSDGPKLVAIDIQDLAVIATEDAVLIVPRDRSQRVKEAVDRLKEVDAPTL